jgi:hypothetical protein
VQRSETVLTSGMTRVLREVLQPGSRVTHKAVSAGPGGGEKPGATAPPQPVVSIASTHGVTSGFVALSRWPIEELTHYARAQVYGVFIHRSDTDRHILNDDSHSRPCLWCRRPRAISHPARSLPVLVEHY